MRRSRRETELELAAMYGELERLRDELDELLETEEDPLAERSVATNRRTDDDPR